MANDGQRRMVFDLRGRRRHVVKVVYAILAVLMGLSLFLVVGPVNVGELLGGGSSGNASEVFTEQATRIERKLKKEPSDAELLSALTRARINAGNALVEVTATGQRTVTPEARAEYQRAQEAWDRYLKAAGGEANSGLAQLAAIAFFSLAESSGSASEAEENVKAAAAAQRIVAEDRPTLNSLSTQAIYDYYALDFAAGDKAAAQAKAKATKAQKKELERQLGEIRKRAKQFQKQVKEEAKLQKSQSKEKLENPLFGGLGGGGGAAP